MDAPDILREIYGRYARGDLEGVAAMCHPGFEHCVMPGNDMMPFSGRYQGVDAVLTRLHGLLDAFTYERFEPIEVFGTPDKAAGRVALRMTVKSNNVTVEGEVAHIVTVRDGKVVELHEYFDSDRFARAMA